MRDIINNLKDLLSDYSPGNVESHLVDIERSIELLHSYDEALRLMVYQYCSYTVGDAEVFNHCFMCAGENAFKVLGITNGDLVPEDFI